MSTWRALRRLMVFVLYTTWTVLRIVIGSFFTKDLTDFGLRRRQQWAATLLPLLGLKMEVEGQFPDFPCILMGNHRSYLDPVMIMRDVPAVPVSKAEVARWPLIGNGAKASGVIFLKRESTTSRKKTLDAIAENVLAGKMVILFPEGTTHSGAQTIAFRRGGFQLAALHGIPIVPVAIDFRYAADNWIDDDTFLAHFFRRFSQPNMEAKICYGPVVAGSDPNLLLSQSQEWINSKLADWQKAGWNL
ncbi:MAG: 1-acyl-sn-glycerol-3-phosphate acyltransferase [Lewinellaceae bacterium]|nr:1-acyl-sn-glycerol-3-phosphate acyltransferase [Lewinellaceae bacterium]